MSPIIRPEVQSIEISMPRFPLSETKLSVVIDMTQDIILDLLMNSMEIYLVQEEVFQNKEKLVNNSGRKYGKRSKGNKLRAPCKDRRSQIESMPKQFVRKLFHYTEPKNSLFYEETIAKIKETVR